MYKINIFSDFQAVSGVADQQPEKSECLVILNMGYNIFLV